jgi:outer membrane protein assembly factor BamB
VLFGSQDAKLYCLKADTGEVVWKYESRDQIRCFPTIVGDRAFVAGCDKNLHVVDLIKGTSDADIDIEGPTCCSPAVMDGNLFVGTEGNTFFALDPRQAKILWRYENADRAAPYRSSAAVTPEAVIVGSRDKYVHALDPKTGRKLWDFATKRKVDSSPVVVGSRVFVGSSDGRVYGLDLKTGREVWRYEAGGEVNASPAVAAGRMVIGTDAGNLYCFGAKER